MVEEPCAMEILHAEADVSRPSPRILARSSQQFWCETNDLVRTNPINHVS
jgi:hypothetical protein